MKQKTTGSKSTVGTLVLMVVVAFAIVTLYYGISNGDRAEKKSQTEVKEVQSLLSKDLESGYPETPREVVKLYLRIMTCYYNEELTEEELEGLAQKAYALFDDELADQNPWESYLKQLEAEINQYKLEERVVSSYEINKANTVKYYTKEDREYASISAEIITRDAQVRYKTGEKFILRINADGKYKILGWQITEDANLE